jgi:hypothetical protein
VFGGLGGGIFGVENGELADEDGVDIVDLGVGGLAEAGGLDGDGGDPGDASGEFRGVALFDEETGEGEAEGADFGIEAGVGGGVANGAAEGTAEDGGEAARFEAVAEEGEGVRGVGEDRGRGRGGARRRGWGEGVGHERAFLMALRPAFQRTPRP